MSRIWTFVEMRWAKKGLSTLAHMDLKKVFPKEFYFMMDFLSIDEENVLADTLSKQFRKKSYEGSHWDSVITRYKEIELLSTRGQYQNIEHILRRCRETIDKTLEGKHTFLTPHAIDLADDGFIDPHVDSIKFSGDIIAGVSLLSSRQMRLSEENSSSTAARSFTITLPPRSMYIIKGALRYHYNHSILSNGESFGRRLSVIFRDAHPDDIPLSNNNQTLTS